MPEASSITTNVVRGRGFEVSRFRPVLMFLIRAYVHGMITTDAVRGRGFEVSRFRPVLMFLIRAYVHGMITTHVVSMHAWG